MTTIFLNFPLSLQLFIYSISSAATKTLPFKFIYLSQKASLEFASQKCHIPTSKLVAIQFIWHTILSPPQLRMNGSEPSRNLSSVRPLTIRLFARTRLMSFSHRLLLLLLYHLLLLSSRWIIWIVIVIHCPNSCLVFLHHTHLQEWSKASGAAASKVKSILFQDHLSVRRVLINDRAKYY